MFDLKIDDIDVVVLRRILLRYAIDLEMSQAKVEADEHKCIISISEQGFRFINYAQQLGEYAKEVAK